MIIEVLKVKKITKHTEIIWKLYQIVYIIVENIQLPCSENIPKYGKTMEKPKTVDHHGGALVIHPYLLIATNYAISEFLKILKME